MKAAGAYVFAGLFTTGIINAGFDVVGVVEDGLFGVETARLNFPTIPVFPTPTYWPIKQFQDMELDLLYGNPPCAGYSMATRDRGIDNPKNAYLDKANELGWKVRPKAFMVESVSQLFKDGIPQVERWEAGWQKLGYNTCRLLESSNHLGLPQARKRAIFVAAQANLDFYLPHVPETTVRDAIWDLSVVPDDSEETTYGADPTSGYAERLRGSEDNLTWHISKKVPRKMATLLPYLRQGKRMRAIEDEIYEQTYWKGDDRDVKGKPSFLYARASWDQLSPVLTGGITYVHPQLDRFLSVRESARIMGLPDWFRFTRFSQAYAEIGKAVSPVVGEWIGSQLIEILNDPQGREHQEFVDLREMTLA